MIGLLLREASDRLRVRLNMYLVNKVINYKIISKHNLEPTQQSGKVINMIAMPHRKKQTLMSVLDLI